MMIEDLLDEIYQFLDYPARYEKYICCRCCFHDDTRPSMFVYEDSYYCSACGAKGKTKTLLEKLRRKHGVFVIREDKQRFSNPWTHWLAEYGDLTNIIERAHRCCINQNRTVYLSKRGIDLETIKELNLGWLDDWVTFPIYSISGELIGATARAGETNKAEAKYVNPKNQDANLLYVPSWDHVKKADKVFLVYGIIDSISIYQLGYASISTTAGKRIDPEVFENIRKKIIIIPDHGEEIDACRLSARLGWRGSVLKVNWRDTEKDVNDTYCRDKEELRTLLEGQHGNNFNGSK